MHKKITTILCQAAVGMACLASIGHAAPLFNKADCETQGGIWANGGQGTGRLGSCTVPQQLTVPYNYSLEVGPSIDLIVPSGARLINNGDLVLLGTSRLLVHGGVVNTSDRLTIHNNAEVVIDRGWLNNIGYVDVDGKLTNGPSSGTVFTWGIFNRGRIQIKRGGELWNYGELIDMPSIAPDYRNIVVDLNGTFLNELDGRWHPREAHVFGHVRNAKGAEILLREKLRLYSSGSIANAGFFLVWSEQGELVIDEMATLSSTFGSTLQVDGGYARVSGHIDLAGGTLENRFDANTSANRFWVMSTGLVTVQMAGHLINRKDANFDNYGTIVLKCIAYFTEEEPIGGSAPLNAPCQDFKPKSFPTIAFN